MGQRLILARLWRFPKVVLGLFVVELCLTVAVLALYGIADPNLYRTKLWKDGFENGFNSDPGQVLYAYANHVKPNIPLVWSQLITTFNLVIAILTVFILLTKSVMFVMKTWFPLLSLAIHLALTACYAFSTYSQLSSDTSDPEHLQNGPPWYITKSCSVVHEQKNYGYCMQAKASLGATVAMAGILFIQVILAAISVVPSKLEKEMRGYLADDSDDESYPHGPVTMYSPEKEQELVHDSQPPPQESAYSPLPQKQAFAPDSQVYEMRPMTSQKDVEAQAEQHHSSFAHNLVQTYLQHSPARAITTSEPTPPFARDSPRPSPQAIPVFDPPPTAPLPTPRTMAFNRLTGRTTKAATSSSYNPPPPPPKRSLLSFSKPTPTSPPVTTSPRNDPPQPSPPPKLSRKQRKDLARMERNEQRRRDVERYMALQRAGPPSSSLLGRVQQQPQHGYFPEQTETHQPEYAQYVPAARATTPRRVDFQSLDGMQSSAMPAPAVVQGYAGQQAGQGVDGGVQSVHGGLGGNPVASDWRASMGYGGASQVQAQEFEQGEGQVARLEQARVVRLGMPQHRRAGSGGAAGRGGLPFRERYGT